MSTGSDIFSESRRASLRAIGRCLRTAYDAAAEPMPERLVALVKQLERSPKLGGAEIERSPQSAAPLPLRLDPDGLGLSVDPPSRFDLAGRRTDPGIGPNVGAPAVPVGL